MKTPKVLPEETGRDWRRQADAQRLDRLDRHLAALVPFLRAVADRIEEEEVTDADVTRLRLEAHLLSREIPPDLPMLPGERTREE